MATETVFGAPIPLHHKIHEKDSPMYNNEPALNVIKRDLASMARILAALEDGKRKWSIASLRLAIEGDDAQEREEAFRAIAEAWGEDQGGGGGSAPTIPRGRSNDDAKTQKTSATVLARMNAAFGIPTSQGIRRVGNSGCQVEFGLLTPEQAESNQRTIQARMSRLGVGR
jgi:hypothetical protein